MFFKLVLKLFFSDLVLIENQLILISYEKVRLKEEGPKWKRAPNMDDMPKVSLKIHFGLEL
jgi:hypothetical protein